ncbi:MAG: DNA repair protein RecO [Anaerorhabdus sp.]
MNDVIKAIVLKQSQYRENDLLVSVLTQTGGRLMLVARGAQKMTSKNAVSCTPFVEGEYIVDLQEGKTMFTLKTGALINSYRHVRDSLESVHIAQLFAEMIEIIIPQGSEEDSETYELLSLCLNKLDGTLESKCLSLAFFLAKMLEIQGISPLVDSCVFCGSTAVQGISCEHGGFVCQNCAAEAEDMMMTNKDILRRFRIINKAKLEHYSILEEQGNWKIQDVEILMDFFQNHLEVRSKTWGFLKDLLQGGK